MALLAYNNKNNTLVRRINLPGARYIFNITVSFPKGIVQFIGQANEVATINISQLYIPIVQTLDANLQPPPPTGLAYVHLTDPFKLDDDNAHYPVLTIADLNLWGTPFCQYKGMRLTE